MAMITHGVRRAGSAAIDLAYVACGRLDLFWEFGLKPWDQAAGMLLITEAGGRCSDMKGGPADVRGIHLLADNGVLHEETVELFGEIFQGQYRYPMPQIAP
jgi:myo-inositol-1(or 4)-monophosphatase